MKKKVAFSRDTKNRSLLNKQCYVAKKHNFHLKIFSLAFKRGHRKFLEVPRGRFPISLRRAKRGRRRVGTGRPTAQCLLEPSMNRPPSGRDRAPAGHDDRAAESPGGHQKDSPGAPIAGFISALVHSALVRTGSPTTTLCSAQKWPRG